MSLTENNEPLTVISNIRERLNWTVVAGFLVCAVILGLASLTRIANNHFVLGGVNVVSSSNTITTTEVKDSSGDWILTTFLAALVVIGVYVIARLSGPILFQIPDERENTKLKTDDTAYSATENIKTETIDRDTTKLKTCWMGSSEYLNSESVETNGTDESQPNTLTNNNKYPTDTNETQIGTRDPVDDTYLLNICYLFKLNKVSHSDENVSTKRRLN